MLQPMAVNDRPSRQGKIMAAKRYHKRSAPASHFRKALFHAQTWFLLVLCLLALQTHTALGQAPVTVKTPQELQDAVNAFSRYILITEHLILTDLNAGTPNEGSLVFPDGAGDFAIWGQCNQEGLPYSVQVYNTAHGRGELVACSLHTETKSNTSTSELSAIKFTDGRLLLSNIIVDTADTDASPDPNIAAILNKGKADFGISVQNAELWLVESVVAFFSGSNVKAVDSHVFFINSLTFQAGPLTNWNEGAVDFLQFADQGSNEHMLTLYGYNTIFHQDNLHAHGPVYVGPLVSNGSISVVRGTPENSLKSPPQIVFNMVFAHTHETTQPGCTSICICAPGAAQPQLYLNTTDEKNKNYVALVPEIDTECTNSTSTPSVETFSSIPFSAVVPPGHEEWAKGLVAANVPNADLLLDPTGGGGGSGSSLSGGAIAGIVITIIVVVMLLSALVAFLLWRKRRKSRHDSLVHAPKDPQAPLPPAGTYLPHEEEQFGTYAPDGKPLSFQGSIGPAGVHSEHRYYGDSGRRPVSGDRGPLVGYYGEPGSQRPYASSHASSASERSGYSAGARLQPAEDPFAAPVPYHVPSGSTQHTRSTAGTLTTLDRKTLGAVSAGGSQSADANATFESLTKKRAAGGGPVSIDFELLDSMLDEVENRWEGVLLERYISLGSSKRSYGGQGAVQFATLKFNTEKKVAIKFFLSKTAFYTEQSLYVNKALHHILPPIEDVSDNQDGRYTDPFGRRFPPFVVMEKGQPLDTFQRRSKPDFPSCMQIIHHLIKRIAELHACGFTHRDLKPSNTIWLSSRNEWTIIDFGSTAKIGSMAALSVSLGYAAPETMKARVEGQNQVIADPAVDVWALGVVAIELLTGQKTYPHNLGANFEEMVIAKTIRGEEFPWEVATEFATIRKRLGFMNDALLRMVARDPAERPTLKEVDAEWRKILQQGTMMDSTAVP